MTLIGYLVWLLSVVFKVWTNENKLVVRETMEQPNERTLT